MSDQNIKTSGTNSDRYLQPIIDQLNKTRRWVKIIATTGFIISALIFYSTFNSMWLPLWGYLLVAISVIIFYTIPSYILFNYMKAICEANENISIKNISKALSFQATFWKYITILMFMFMIIKIVIYVIKINYY